jgi:hypothetical protein
MPMSAVQDWVQEYNEASIVDELKLCFGEKSIIVNRPLFFAFSLNRMAPSGERDQTVACVRIARPCSCSRIYECMYCVS